MSEEQIGEILTTATHDQETSALLDYVRQLGPKGRFEVMWAAGDGASGAQDPNPAVRAILGRLQAWAMTEMMMRLAETEVQRDQD